MSSPLFPTSNVKSWESIDDPTGSFTPRADGSSPFLASHLSRPPPCPRWSAPLRRVPRSFRAQHDRDRKAGHRVGRVNRFAKGFRLILTDGRISPAHIAWSPMKDAAPRIFRSLERQPVQQQFDTVVTAAITAYGALRHPSQRQADDMARHVVPLWSKIVPETRRNVAAALSHSARVPRSLVDLLILRAHRGLRALPDLRAPPSTKRDIAHLRKTGDERALRLPRQPHARRAEGPAPAVVAPDVEAAKAPPQRSRPSRDGPRQPVALGRLPVRDPASGARAAARRAGPSVDSVREALAPSRLDRPHGPAGKARRHGSLLLLLAMERQEAAFYDMLAEALPNRRAARSSKSPPTTRAAASVWRWRSRHSRPLRPTR